MGHAVASLPRKNVAFLTMAALLVGILEAVAQVAAPAITLRRPYSPGMLTTLLVLLPITVSGIVYAVGQGLMAPLAWLFAFLYMLVALMLTQQIVVRASGMRYADFLRNVRTAFFGKS